ncbi:MAG TPA: NAD-dependent succinate-semialdehyde dehydrogenase [bacterium]|nr:NAD-dependent succinate-semialdehyde dehydrogenase [bacterium]
MPIQSINPTTGEILRTFNEFTPDQIDTALEQAHQAARRWRATSFAQRAGHMRALAQGLRSDKARWAGLITAEMGKPIVEAEAEIEKCAWNCEFYAEYAERFLAPESVPTSAIESYVEFEPLGVVLAIMPWNFPFWQVFRFLAPALMAGNGSVLKHASNVPLCALAIEEVVKRAGFPQGLFRTVLVGGSGVAGIIADQRVQAVTLTGSSVVGAEVAATAGRHIKKQVLELGGSDPFIVLADADLDEAARTGVRARNQNTGQSCIAAKRFIVEDAAADAFVAKFAEAVRALRVGDPTDRATNVGPLARGDLREDLIRQVDAARSKGARVVTGGASLNGRGYFYAPTVLDEITADSPVFKEETFGPVAAVIRAPDVDEAVRLANDSQYGLGASLWTRDLSRAKDIAPRIEAGSVFVNAMVVSDPRLPFGGIKHSGYGRELGEFGIREFTNIQTVCIGSPVGAAAATRAAAE